MKRALSFILALCMIIALAPASFAASSSHSILYSFGNDYKTQQGEHASGDLLATYTYEKTNDHFAFYSSNLLSIPSDSKFSGYYLQLLAENRAIIDGEANGVGSWYAFELNVPAGTYSVEIVHGRRASGAVEEIYFLDSAEMADVENNFTTDNLLTEVDVNGAVSNWVTKNIDKELVVPTSGKYYLIVRAKDVTNGRYMSIRQLRATTRTNTTEVPYAALSSVEKSVAVGGTADISTVVKTSYFNSSSSYVVNSYSNAGTEVTFAYSSGDTSIATVSDTGTVTGVKPGNTSITVSATLNGVTVTDTVDVEVTLANPSGINAKYDFYTDLGYNFNIGNITYNDTRNTFKYHSRKETWNPAHENFRIMGGLYQAAVVYHDWAGQWYALELNVPAKGDYKAELGYAKRSSGASADIYVLEAAADVEANIADESVNPVCTVDCGATSTSKVAEDIGTLSFDEAGKYILVVNPKATGYTTLRYLSLNGGDGTSYMGATIKADKSALSVGETATVKASGYLSDRTAVGTVSDWQSSDETVAAVSGGTVTAVGAGTAEISAKVTYGSDESLVKTAITVSDIEVGNNISFAVDGAKEVYINGVLQEDYTALDMLSVPRGQKIKVVALSDEGKTFRCWVRGSADNGRLISTDNEYEFTAATHTMLTAVYIDTPTADTTEYYNWNGEFLGTTEPTGSKAPSLIGYVFANTWKDAGKSGLVSRKIAEFTKETATYAVTKGAEESFALSVKDDNYTYDSEVSCSSDKEVYWYRDGKLVDYGKDYKFFIWDATEITTSDKGHDGAKIILDDVKENGSGKSYMIEYDKGGSSVDIVEVGIIFGTTKDITIDSCAQKRNSQREDFSHGQFTATSDTYDIARGYLIYNDGTANRVIYAD